MPADEITLLRSERETQRGGCGCDCGVERQEGVAGRSRIVAVRTRVAARAPSPGPLRVIGRLLNAGCGATLHYTGRAAGACCCVLMSILSLQTSVRGGWQTRKMERRRRIAQEEGDKKPVAVVDPRRSTRIVPRQGPTGKKRGKIAAQRTEPQGFQAGFAAAAGSSVHHGRGRWIAHSTAGSLTKQGCSSKTSCFTPSFSSWRHSTC